LGWDYHQRWFEEVPSDDEDNHDQLAANAFLGGLLAGLIIQCRGVYLNGVILQKDWAAAMKDIGRPEGLTGDQIVAFDATGFLIGIFAIRLYAAIRPRYGPGPKTVVCPGAAVWTIGYLLRSIAPMVLHILPRRLIAIGILVGLGEVIVGASAGTWLLQGREPDSSWQSLTE
jgi:hypothetical protein